MKIELSRDWSEFLCARVARRVRFVLVGGHAVAGHGEPRLTEDLDVFVEPSLANARRLRDALVDFGFGREALIANKKGAAREGFARRGAAQSKPSSSNAATTAPLISAWRGPHGPARMARTLGRALQARVLPALSGKATAGEDFLKVFPPTRGLSG